ncbi:MAG: dTMP kinase [Candidatus Levyibacteriota bacterium]
MKYHVEFDLEFKKNPYKGRYIVLEGVNASGKSTQAKKLKEYFQKKGIDILTVDEPTHDLIIGKFVRKIITEGTQIPRSALQYLYTADRIINHESVILPALEAGKVVLSSRSFWSAVVYGVVDQGKHNYSRPDANLLLVAQGILSQYHKITLPDYTFYLDTPVDLVIERMAKMNNTKDIYETKEKLDQLLRGYRWLVKEFPQEFTTIDASKSVEDVTTQITNVVNKHFSR